MPPDPHRGVDPTSSAPQNEIASYAYVVKVETWYGLGTTLDQNISLIIIISQLHIELHMANI